MPQYVALLRGINVGGNNIIKMADLKQSFEAVPGVVDVATFIQSGNVLFAADDEPSPSLAARIEAALAARFSYHGRLALRSHAQLRAIVGNAPAGFGSQANEYQYDVLFVRDPVTAAEAIQSVKPKEGVDQVFAGDGVCYFSRLRSRAAQSYLSRVVGLPIYQHLTIRNWNTTTRLEALLDARAR